MKGLSIGLTALALMLLGGWSAADKQPAPPIELRPKPRTAGSVEQIAGMWYAFPAGLLLQFNDDGSAQFGLDQDGTAIGYEAMIWFEGQELLVNFTNYTGQDEGSASAAGRYTVQLHEGGNISFVPVHDDCTFRMASLSGVAEAGFKLMYHPVQD